MLKINSDEWEYRVEELNVNGGYDVGDWVPLDRLGKDGWELVSVVVLGASIYGWFKRCISRSGEADV